MAQLFGMDEAQISGMHLRPWDFRALVAGMRSRREEAALALALPTGEG